MAPEATAPGHIAAHAFPSVTTPLSDRRGPEVRLALRVVLELTTPPAPGAVVVAPFTATQDGLASRLSVTQGAVSKVLRHLRAAGVIRRDRGHVAGFGRRVLVYSLTPRGEALVRAYRTRFGMRDPEPAGPGTPSSPRP